MRPVLDYSAKLRFRISWRRMILVGVGAVFVVVGWLYGPEVYRRAVFQYYQGRCLGHTLLPDTIVYDTNPTTAARFIDDEDYHDWSGGIALRRPPTVSSRVLGPPLAVYGWGGAFLHERRGLDGMRWLVSVDIFKDETGHRPLVCFAAHRVVKATESAPEPGPRARRVRALEIQLEPGEPVTIFAGQADRDNASHFTLAILLGQRRITWDAYVGVDGDISVQPQAGHLGPYARRYGSDDYSGPGWDYELLTADWSPP